MYKVYILKSKRGHIYVGSTSSLSKRILRHKSRQGAEYTKRNTTYKLVYSKSYKTLKEARRRERQIKGWRREKKENLIKYGRPLL